MLPSTLEWHAAVATVAAGGVFWLPALFVALGMLGLSLLVAVLQAAQAKLPAGYGGFSSRLVVAALCYTQPLVRSWHRYRTRFFHPCVIVPDAELPAGHGQRMPLSGERTVEYWSEKWQDRTELLNMVTAYLTERRWAKETGAGWEAWDLVIYCHPMTEVYVTTVQEDHGSGRRLIRARFLMRLGTAARLAVGLGLVAAAAVGASVDWIAGAGIAAGVLAVTGIGWLSAARRAARAVAVFDHAAQKLGLFRCGAAAEGPSAEGGRA
jgi:hypothetical protein